MELQTQTTVSMLFSRFSLDVGAGIGGLRSNQGPVKAAGHDHGKAPGQLQRPEHAEKAEKHHHAHGKHDHGQEHDDHASDGESTSLSYRSRQGTSLMIQTQEGDLVKLKIKAGESLSLESDQALGQDGTTTIATRTLESRSNLQVSFKVEGDLNADELASIQSVIDQVGDMAGEFFAGDTQGAFSTAADFQIDATQLAAVRYRLQTSEQFTYSRTGAAVLPTVAAPLAPAPDVAPAPGEVAPDEVATADTPASAPAPAAPGDAAPAATKTTDQGDSVDPASAPTQPQPITSALQTIGTFLHSLVTQFGGDGEFTVHAETSLKLQVLSSLLVSVSESSTTAQEKAGTALAADTIDVVSAQENPLKAVA